LVPKQEDKAERERLARGRKKHKPSLRGMVQTSHPDSLARGLQDESFTAHRKPWHTGQGENGSECGLWRSTAPCPLAYEVRLGVARA
jgi:hypothetical protein